MDPDRQLLSEQLVNFFESDPLTGVMPESHAAEVMALVDKIVERTKRITVVRHSSCGF